MKSFLQKLNKDTIIYILEFIYKDKINDKNKYLKSLLLYNSFYQLYNKLPKLKIYSLRNPYININYIQYKIIHRKDEDPKNIDFRLIGYHEYLIIRYKINYTFDTSNKIITYSINKNVFMYDKNNRCTARDGCTYLNIYKRKEETDFYDKNNIFILDQKKIIHERRDKDVDYSRY